MKPMLPTRPSRDVNEFSASWIGKLLDCVKYAMEYPKGDAKTIRRDGGTLHVIPRPGGGSATSGSETAKETVLCKITGKEGDAYLVDLYANGQASTSTGSGELLILDLNYESTVPNGTWVVGHVGSTLILNDGSD